MSFGATSTAAEVIDGIDLHDEVAVITGATGGIGLETARALASAGATVVLGNRSQDRSTAAVADLRATVPGGTVEAHPLDLTSPASVREFAGRVLADHDRIGLVINNAGVMATPFERTSDGFELQFATNHLAHFLLTKLLMPAAPARIVNISSNGHAICGVNWDDPNYHRTEYSPWPAYGQSKTANILFTTELERRLGQRGTHAYAVHPGVVTTDLFRHLDDDEHAGLQRRIEESGIVQKTPEQGAATTVYAATARELADHGGSYLEDCHVSGAVAPHASDPNGAGRLWRLSEELIGEPFPT